jgi:hypothetical protein
MDVDGRVVGRVQEEEHANKAEARRRKMSLGQKADIAAALGLEMAK